MTHGIECAICFSEASTPLVGICGHIFCSNCVQKTAQASLNKIAERRNTFGPVSLMDCIGIALSSYKPPFIHSQEDTFLKDEVKTAKKAEKLIKGSTATVIAVPECPTCKRPGAFHTLYFNK